MSCLPGLVYSSESLEYLSNGPSERRVDLAILGDGFTAEQRDLFYLAAETLAESFLGESPFASYHDHFNVRLLFTASNESGADDPSEGVFRDTAFGAAFDCFNIARLLCIDSGAVANELAQRLEPDQHDIVLVVVNDDQYGGSGGAFPVTSMHELAPEIAIHEIGHSFGRLADEYESDQATCDFYRQWVNAPNIEESTVRSLIRWNVNGGPPTGWIDSSRLLPSADELPSLPGLYEGGALCPADSGLYRPTFNSKMRSLGQPFDQINSEQLVLAIYQQSGVFENSAQGGESVFAVTEETLPLSLSVVGNPAQLSFSWTRDDTQVSTSASLAAEYLSPGVSRFEFEVTDSSGFVRNDSAGSARAGRELYIAYGDEVESAEVDLESEAELLVDNVSVAGTLRAGVDDDVDYFRMEAPISGQVSIRAAAYGPGSAEVSLRLSSTESSWTKIFQVQSFDLTTIPDFSPPAGAISVEVSSPLPAAYSLQVEYAGVDLQPGVPDVQVGDAGFGVVEFNVRPADGESFVVVSYQAECRDDQGVWQAEGPGPRLAITGLDESGAYRCSVRATNAFGAGEPYQIPGTIVPATPAGGLPVWLLREAIKRED